MEKFTSRKFIVSLITTICGILGMINIADSTIGLIGSILMIIIPNVIYIITEGSIDRESVKSMLIELSKVISENDVQESDK